MPSPDIVFSLSADGRTVAEAVVADVTEAESLLAAAREAGSDVAWAHGPADLTALGFGRQWGYRRLTGRSGRAAAGPSDEQASAASAAGDDRPREPGSARDVAPLSAQEDSAELCAAAFRGQWGHKTPGQWPPDLAPGTVTLGLRRDGRTVGICRVEPADGLIDAPGLVAEYRDATGYAILLRAAMAAVQTPAVTVHSWGDGPDRLEACQRLGLTTAEYVPGWEFDLRQ